MSTPSTANVRVPHYLRFVCAIALVSAAGCQQLRERVGCEHCHCNFSPASLRQPVSCDLAGPDYCCMPVPGPLSPPELAV
jgi:hypothetical protein